MAEANAAWSRSHGGHSMALAHRSSGDLAVESNPSGLAGLLTPFNLVALGIAGYLFDFPKGFKTKVNSTLHIGS